MAVEWRGVDPATDLDAWAEALAAIEAVDRTGEVLGRADLEEQVGLSYFDPMLDARLAWDDGLVVAWGTVVCLPNARQRRVDLAGAVVPGRRGHGLGTALIAWQVERGQEIAAARDSSLPAWLELTAALGDQARAELFGAFEFIPRRYFHEMRRSLQVAGPAVDLGPGFRLVPFEGALDERTRRAHNEAFLDHVGSSELDPETWRTWVTGERGFRADCSFLALTGDEIVGYVLCGVHPDDWRALGFTEGWVHHLGVRRPFRGRGVASALLAACTAAFAADGLDFAALEVDAENPTGARALYERAGFERTKTRVLWARDLD